MSQNTKINQLIIEIIKNNSKVDAIKKLMKIVPEHTDKNLKMLQQTILYLIEAEHDWTNLIKFIFQWKKESWGRQFLVRMRQRVNQTQKTYENLEKQLYRLADRYWLLKSPKKNPQSYDEYLKPKNEQKNDGYRFSKRFSFNMVPPRIENAAKNAVKFNMDRVSEKKEIEKKKSVQQNINEVNKKQQREVPVLDCQIERQRPKTPHKKPINQNKIKILENSGHQSNKNDFSFSVVKPREAEKQITAQKPKLIQFEQDFQAFESQEKNKVKNTIDPYDLSFQEFQAQRKKEKSILMSRKSYSSNREMFSEQEMALIDFSKPPVNKLKSMLISNGISAKQMLKTALNQV